MASQAKTLIMERELLSLLKVDNKGWNMTLFTDPNKMSVCLCASCGFVCCDAVELDCDHNDDEDIFLYCKQCLIHLIQQNENKCIINSHINPQITANKANRRHVLKSIVICPYSQQYKMRNILQKNNRQKNNRQIMDTFGENNININDEKEGNQPFKSNDDEKNEKKCEWKGKLTDLINKHILQCATTNNPTFALNIKIKNLEQEITKLRAENKREWDKMLEIRNENEDLRKELATEKNNSVNMRLMEEEYKHRMDEYEKEKDKLLQEQEALNGVVDEERRKIDVLMNAFGAKEKAAIITQNNLRNIQNKQANELNDQNEEIKKLKEIIKAKESEINQQILLIKDLLNEKNKKEEEKKGNEFDSKSILNEINIFKGNNHCIVDLKKSIFTTKGTDKNRQTKTYTYGILEIPWSKDTNGGIHEFKLQCLQSALSCIAIGMVTNSKAKTGNKWLFNAKECGISYQLYVGSFAAIWHHQNGKQQYEQKPAKRKPISPEWQWKMTLVSRDQRS